MKPDKFRNARFGTIALLGLTLLNNNSQAETSHLGIKGINYDPAHSQNFLDAQQANRIDIMAKSINNDLEQIHKLGILVIKTFYSEFCTIDGSQCLSIVDLSYQHNLKIALGVFEFAPFAGGERSWTTNQVKAAIRDTYKYSDPNRYTYNPVVAIIVGNEDVDKTDTTNNITLAEYIVSDIETIRSSLGLKAPPIGTAQIDVFPLLHDKNMSKIISVSDFIGVNIYPYWYAGENDANFINIEVAGLEKMYPDKKIIVTEEGWPTAGNGEYLISTAHTAQSGQDEQNKYYSAWKNRKSNFDSYLFGMYDKIPNKERPLSAADNYFGLCDMNGNSKPSSVFHCR